MTAKALWNISSPPLGLQLSAILQMCPGKDSFVLARKPPLFLGSGARPTLSSWHGVSPACDGCRASWHLRIPQGRWLVLSRVPLPALGWHVLVKSKHLHSARQRVCGMCPLGSALGLQHAFWSVLWTHANGLHVEE